jgi:hypothetical protein
MSTEDQLLYNALHGTAMRYAAERRNLDEAIEELRQIADGSNDILAEAAGITAGSALCPKRPRYASWEPAGMEHAGLGRPSDITTAGVWSASMSSTVIDSVLVI